MKAQKIYFGNVITMEEEMPVAEAVAVADGKIIYIGSKAEAMAYADDSTETVDYGKNSIYPGFIEGHCHPLMAGARINLQADLSKGECLKDYLDTLKDWMKAHPGRSNYQGAGWKILDFEPNKAILDEICPDIPMVLNSFDGHSIWVNSAAIEEYGFNADKVKEFGTDLIRVDENGEVTGYISEKPALDLVSKLVMMQTPETLAENILAWQDFAFSQGITACHDAGLNPGGMKVMAALTEKNLLKMRTCVDLLVDEKKETDMQAIVDRACEAAALYNTEYTKLKGIKVFVDGVIEAHTGWLLDEYADAPGYHGIQRFADPENMKQLAMKAAEKNLFIHTHCIGDAATKYVVDGIEAARKIDGRYDQRNCIAHLQIIKDEEIKRMADLNITAIVAPLWAPKTVAPAQDKIEIASLGEDRFENEYPIQSFMNAGGMIVFHTDYPVSPSISIPRSIYMAVTRKNPDNAECPVKNEPECITRMDALKAMTVNAAIQIGEEDTMGSLKAGKIANMVVYDSDYTKDDMDVLVKAELQATIVDGDIVYSV